MTGNETAPVSDAELAQLLADHQARLIANKRRNDQAAELKLQQRAKALGVQLD
jgi:GAF domain-containing protein